MPFIFVHRTNQLFMNQAVVFRFGILLGLVSILSMLLAYMIDLTWMVSGWNSLISIALVFAAMLMACIEDRKGFVGGYSYGRAVVQALMTGLVGSLLGVVFTGVLYNVVDPNLHERVKEIMVIKMEESFESFGMSEEDSAKAMESFEKRSFKQDFRSLGSAFLLSGLMNTFFALIVGLFVRRKEDPFGSNPTETLPS